jgi:hypothetical protein
VATGAARDGQAGTRRTAGPTGLGSECSPEKSRTHSERRPDPRRLGQVLHRDGQAVQRPGERAAGGLLVQRGGRGSGLPGGEREWR